MELRDGDIQTASLDAGRCSGHRRRVNHAEIHHWIPAVPSPYTELDARAFVEGEVPGIGTQQFAITQDGRLVRGSIRKTVSTTRARVTSATGVHVTLEGVV